jgi:hypothetical protein
MLSRGLHSATVAKPVLVPLPIPGPQGPAGSNGANGTIINVGSGAPVTTVGNVGDMYLDNSTGYWYGPKTSTGGWGTQIP